MEPRASVLRVAVYIVAACLIATTHASYSNTTGLKVGYFLRGIKDSSYAIQNINADIAAELEGLSHYRLIPGLFPDGMNYHFDGLATVLKFTFNNGQIQVSSKYFESEAEKNYNKCIFFGTGTGPTLGREICFTNPGVNLLPLNNQLWLTIDTAFWGRMDLDTLATVPASVKVKSTVLNAHPACDPKTQECFVQYPCSPQMYPVTNQACVSKLVWTEGDMETVELSRITLPKNKIIQHTHSPCVTPNYVVAKLDAFGPRFENSNSGLLKLMHQVEDNQWMVHDRRTNTSRFMTSGSTSFVNNHFWNCYETEEGVVVDTIAATEDYLDSYFGQNLQKPTQWDKMFQPPYRCIVPPTGDSIKCENLMLNMEGAIIYDYPTFNPLYKMNPEYKYFYAIAATSYESKWFDKIVKIDAKERVIAQSWSKEGVFLTEADFVPRKGAKSEDDGFLISVLYDSKTDTSSIGIFNAQAMELIAEYKLDQVIPFHAHGVNCVNGKCYTNP
eukprot:Colp12_sorted_trinity150504_noHs@32673